MTRSPYGKAHHGEAQPSGSPFDVLGLPASRDVTDDDVRSAWRRIAASTHPDRPGGGDPERFAAASAAYTALRTRTGRAEALAETPLRVSPPGRQAVRDLAPAGTAILYPERPPGLVTRAVARVRHGRPALLAVRLLIAFAVGAVSATLVGSAPATPALITGALTWFVLTARHDLAPPS
ncbi:MAG: J domain-containing protein [Micromonosporaceae bacterium]